MKENREEGIDDATTVAVGLVVGAVSGTVAGVIYHTTTEEQRTNWDKKRLMHHGPAGLIVAGISSGVYLVNHLWFDDPRIRKAAEFGMSVGVGMALSDIADGDRWLIEGRIARAIKGEERKWT